MKDEMLINNVCKKFNTTSRTLRYYEQIGLIKSIQFSTNVPRKYDDENIEKIRKILFLRSLGLSLSDIKDILSHKDGISSAVASKRAYIVAQANTLAKQMRTLEKVITALDEGEDIFAISFKDEYNSADNEICLIAANITDKIIAEQFDECYTYFSKKLTEYLPPNVLETVWRDTIAEAGNLIKLQKIYNESNIVFACLQYAKIGIRSKYVFANKTISGLWTDYFEL